MGRRIRSKSIRSGRNEDITVPSDTAYVRCSRCGFICNTERDISAPEGSRLGWGITYTPYYLETTITSTYTETEEEIPAEVRFVIYNDDGEIIYNDDDSVVTGETA